MPSRQHPERTTHHFMHSKGKEGCLQEEYSPALRSLSPQAPLIHCGCGTFRHSMAGRPRPLPNLANEEEGDWIYVCALQEARQLGSIWSIRRQSHFSHTCASGWCLLWRPQQERGMRRHESHLVCYNRNMSQDLLKRWWWGFEGGMMNTSCSMNQIWIEL